MTKLCIALCALLSLSSGVARAGDADEQAKIGKIISDICEAAQKKELDRLDSFHDYGPRFSKFDDDGLGRQDAATGKKGERDGIGGVKSFAAKVSDLKVDLFGSTAIATFILAYDVDTGKEKMSGKDRSTLVFVKRAGTWKIVHEHHSPLKTAS
jgi:ketosteroid isomerase-like protein